MCKGLINGIWRAENGESKREEAYEGRRKMRKGEKKRRGKKRKGAMEEKERKKVPEKWLRMQQCPFGEQRG